MRRTVIFGAAAALLCAFLTGCGPAEPVALPAMPSAVAEPSGEVSPSTQPTPSASVATSPSARPVASPKPSAKPKPTGKPKLVVTSVALKAAFVGTSLEATATIKTTGYGTVVLRWFASDGGGFTTGTFTVTGTGANTFVRHVSADVLACHSSARRISFSVGPDTQFFPGGSGHYYKQVYLTCG